MLQLETNIASLFSLENRQKRLAFDKDMPGHQLGLSIAFTESTLSMFARLHWVIVVAALLFSNDYMLTC